MLLLICGLAVAVFPMGQSFDFPGITQLPQAAEAVEKLAEVKSKADDLKLTEEQFFQCFTDINCNLGPDVKQEMYDCYSKVKPEEMDVYTQWFADSPKGNFSKLDMYGINEEFCSLSRSDQREVNDHFLESVKTELAALCKNTKNFGMCNRLRIGNTCMTMTVKDKVLSKECDTFVSNIPSMPE